jgi:predicted secreted protein
MAYAITEKYEELVLEISEDSGSTWTKICGITNVTVNRSANTDTAEVPECDDESLPHKTEREVRSLDFTASGTGVWAQQSHGTLIDWFYSGASKDCRIGNLNAATGETEYETGVALLTQLGHSRTKGQKVSAEISLEFDGVPTRTNAS